METPTLFNQEKVPNAAEIWHAFDAMREHHRRFSKTYTSVEDVLQFMLDHPQKIWWWAWEFNSQTNSKGKYLSHRACARASDLALHHGTLVEDRKIGRFKVYRLRRENMSLIKAFLG